MSCRLMTVAPSFFAVIPGRAEGREPGIHNQDRFSNAPFVSLSMFVFMDSGLLASLGPGMTAWLHPLQIEIRFLPRAVARERALRADRVRPLENPVLPGGEPRE